MVLAWAEASLVNDNSIYNILLLQKALCYHNLVMLERQASLVAYFINEFHK